MRIGYSANSMCWARFLQIKNAYHSMQSSWILTARQNIADLYDINAHSSTTDRLAAVNALLQDYTFIYRDSDRELPPAVEATIPSLSSFALKLSNAIPSNVYHHFSRVKFRVSSTCTSSTSVAFKTQDFITGCSTRNPLLSLFTWLPHFIMHFRSGERVAASPHRLQRCSEPHSNQLVGLIFSISKMMAVSSL